MPTPSYRGWIWALALVGFLFDQGTKYGVFHWLHQPQRYNAERFGYSYDVVPGAFGLVARFTGSMTAEDTQGIRGYLRSLGGPDMPAVNHGALFGWLSRHQEHANAGFAAISLAAILAILFWGTRRTTGHDLLLCLALGLILAGTLGNLYDRLVFGGVRDFLDFYLINWPVFNVADCCLVCGAFCLLAQAFLAQPAAKSSLPQQAASPVVAEAK